MNLDRVNWVAKFPIDTLQIYFPCSLELQEELINKGYKIPALGDIKTPIPIIYANYRGWIKAPEPITIERLIPPKWYGKDFNELGWRETVREGKLAYYLPIEEVWLNIGFDDKNLAYFKLDVKNYHLERVSIRGINPEKWNNWAMYYLSYEYADGLKSLLKNHIDESSVQNMYPILEKQQGGKEKTYYASEKKEKSLGIPVKYSLCLGCFELALDYFKYKAIENNLNQEVVNELKLRITHNPSINAGLKIGVAKIQGKRPQIMFKLASSTKIKIKGILKPVIEGKARGNLEFCDHNSKTQVIIADSNKVYSALLATIPKFVDL